MHFTATLHYIAVKPNWKVSFPAIITAVNFFFVLQDLIDRINSYFQRIAFQINLLLILASNTLCHKFFLMKISSLLHWNGRLCQDERKLLVSHSCTNCANLEMEPKYLTKSDIQLKPNISRTKNDKRVL